ncbi:PAS domain S-box protein [Haladaptatus salinisoli]|uniref:PAS domain S-box protein n=1 Tax=Haladaptatus salinisoli TaxID=2884876 RepID=UPI001D09BA2B|nr:bacterio-opsin activator domain-containing protein [Haladaptatus salinisoli]
MGESTSRVTLADTLSAVEEAADVGTPFTASEVADELGCVRRTAYGKLKELAERGDLQTKKVGARGRVWWQANSEPTAVGRSDVSALNQVQLDEFIDSVTDYAIFVLDANGRIRSWNAGARRIKGYTEEEILGEHFSTFYSEEDQKAGIPQRNLDNAAREGRVEDEGIRIRKDGTTFWANVVITALHNDDGDLQGFVKVTRDMTQRHMYEERLMKQKERFEALISEVKDYAIFLLGPSGTVRSWNQGAKQIKGYTEEEILGEHFSTFYSEEDQKAGIPQRNLDNAAREGRVEDEGIRIRKDGTTFWANVVITALHDDDGDIRGYAKITRDMTERHEYEERLREQRDELNELNQINTVIRDIDQALVTARTQGEVGQAVCERLAASDTYSAAWIGEYNEDYEEVTLGARAGLSQENIEAIETTDVNLEDPTERGIGATALRTRSIQSVSRIRENNPSEAWHEETLAEGFESAIMIPLVHNDVEYGILTVYGENESAFDERKIAVLSEMGETISHTIAAIRRKERERTLTALQESTRDLLQTESPEEIGDVIVNAITENLALADALVYLFDTSENHLKPVSASFPLSSYNSELKSLTVGDDSPIWKSFVDGEPQTIEASSMSITLSSRLDERQLLAIPLGNRGILVMVNTRGETLDQQTRNLAGLIGTTAEAAFDRIESQMNLRERDEILQERNQRLQRLNQINTVIREVDQALIQATTHKEVQRVVCERLTDSDRFRFAWIGRTDDADGRLIPEAWSGDGHGYLDSVLLSEGDNLTDPAIRTTQTGEVTVIPNIADDLRSGRWRKEAFMREFQSVISIPLTHESVTHGVLTVYAEQPGVFQEMEQTVFAELGGTIANTLNAVDTRQSLVSDEWVELEFRLYDESMSFLSRLARQAECDIFFEGSVPLSGNQARLFFTVDDANPDDVRGVIDRAVTVESSRLIASQDDGHLFEAVVGGPTIPLTLLEHGASLRTLTVSEDGVRVVVALPSNADIRGFIEQFQTEYESTEFLARRRHERPAHTRQGVRAKLEEQLTERQLEVLQTAYFSGFFASPRQSTGSDIAEVLDVSQPTVTEHLRTAQSKILDLLLID